MGQEKQEENGGTHIYGRQISRLVLTNQLWQVPVSTSPGFGSIFWTSSSVPIWKPSPEPAPAAALFRKFNFWPTTTCRMSNACSFRPTLLFFLPEFKCLLANKAVIHCGKGKGRGTTGGAWPALSKFYERSSSRISSVFRLITFAEHSAELSTLEESRGL